MPLLPPTAQTLGVHLSVVIGELGTRANDATAKPLSQNLALQRHVPQEGHAQAVDARHETAQLLAQQTGQHGDAALSEICARASPPRL